MVRRSWPVGQPQALVLRSGEYYCTDPKAHGFHVQAVLLVEAIGVLDLRAVVPIHVDGLAIGCRPEGDVGEQDEIAVQVGVVGDPGFFLPKMLEARV